MPRPSDPPDLSGFGRFTILRPLNGGHRNAVWLVAGEDGPFVAKSTRRSEAALVWLGPLHQFARQAGFVVPDMRVSQQGRFLSAGWTLERFVEGRAAQPADIGGMLPQLRHMHRLAQGLAQRPGFCAARDLCDRAQGGDVDMAALPRDLAERCRRVWAALDGTETAIYADFGAGNVILTPHGPALIDWDEARRDLPLFDLPPHDDQSREARLAWEIACCWRIEPGHAGALAKTWRPQGA